MSHSEIEIETENAVFVSAPREISPELLAEMTKVRENGQIAALRKIATENGDNQTLAMLAFVAIYESSIMLSEHPLFLAMAPHVIGLLDNSISDYMNLHPALFGPYPDKGGTEPGTPDHIARQNSPFGIAYRAFRVDQETARALNERHSLPANGSLN